jgi:hypothetical protein
MNYASDTPSTAPSTSDDQPSAVPTIREHWDLESDYPSLAPNNNNGGGARRREVRLGAGKTIPSFLPGLEKRTRSRDNEKAQSMY